jgi:hypothetical protein
MEDFWKVVIVLLVIVLAGYLLFGCRPAIRSGDSARIHGSIDRFTDDEAGVVCWAYDAAEKAGLSCLPINETNLTSD